VACRCLCTSCRFCCAWRRCFWVDCELIVSLAYSRVTSAYMKCEWLVYSGMSVSVCTGVSDVWSFCSQLVHKWRDDDARACLGQPLHCSDLSLQLCLRASVSNRVRAAVVTSRSTDSGRYDWSTWERPSSHWPRWLRRSDVWWCVVYWRWLQQTTTREHAQH